MATEAHVRFTVLVEIKTPVSPLVLDRKYRNKAPEIGKDLAGGVVQLQAQCAHWANDASWREGNRDMLSKDGIYTCEPKGILVIGSTEQIKDDYEKRSTFERFRRNLHNPEVLTFDELLTRAEFIVEMANGRANSLGGRKRELTTSSDLQFSKTTGRLG
jgi:antiviral defense system Shedu protein SduA